MKIALLTNGLYPFDIGGMQKHSYYLARYLAQREVYVNIYFYKSEAGKLRTDKNAFKTEELKYITFHELNFPSSIYFPGHYIFNSYRYSRNIYQHLKQNLIEFDFIYVQGFSGWELLKKYVSNHSFPPIGVNFHGLNMFQLVSNRRSEIEQYIFRYPVRYCLQKSDFAFSLGGKLTDIIEKQVNGATEIWEIPIGIEEKWLNPKPDLPSSRRKFIFVGRYERLKGIQELNMAIKKMNNKYDFDFEFVGPIPENKRLKVSNCYYHGPIYGEDKIIKTIDKADVLVCPSYSEGMPTVILEAMSRGLCVIATDVGAVNELVSSETGWLIKPADNSELRKALTEAIMISEQRLHEKKEKSLKLIEKNFTWTNVINITLNKIRSTQ